MITEIPGIHVSKELSAAGEEMQINFCLSLVPWHILPVIFKIDFGIGEPFTLMMLRLMKEKRITAPDLYFEACMDRKLFSKIQTQDNYQPKKYTAVRLALGMRLSLKETEQLLAAAGFTLSSGILKDRVIARCIEQRQCEIRQVNRMLRARGIAEL